MEKVCFPFIMRFVKSFKNENYVFFLLEYIDGIEMFDMIRKIGKVSNELCRFYIASLALCLEYLDGINIIYRDLKP
jgi:cGMP-dependent protein kinase